MVNVEPLLSNNCHFLPYSPEVVTTVTSVCVGRNQTTLGKPPSALRLLATFSHALCRIRTQLMMREVILEQCLGPLDYGGRPFWDYYRTTCEDLSDGHRN